MSHSKIRRALMALTVTAVLALATPAQAGAAPWTNAWRWLDGLWHHGLTVLLGGEIPGPASPQAPGTKQGPCVDPDGCVSMAPGGGIPVCNSWNEAGPCVDPDG